MFKCIVCGSYEAMPIKFIGNINRMVCCDCQSDLDDYADGFEEFRKLYYEYAEAMDAYEVMFQRACNCSATLSELKPYRENIIHLEEKLRDFITECIEDLTNLRSNG